MKKFLLFLLLLTNIAQTFGQQAFSKISLDVVRGQSTITFTIPHEVNIRHYRIEASNDMVNFDVIGLLSSKENSVLPRTYCYSLDGNSYRFYRVGVVCMNAQLLYSDILSSDKQAPQDKHEIYTDPVPATNTITRR